MPQKTLVSSQMQTANLTNVWNADGYSMAADLVDNAQEMYQEYDRQQEEVAFQRLDLEAQKLQNEELNNIRLADTDVDVPQIETGFKNKLFEQFSQDKWGQRWLKKRGATFLKANSVDVQDAMFQKQEELAILETDKTLARFADEIAFAKPDQARALVNQANMMIDNHRFLTPAQKQNTRDNFTELWVSSMVEHNTDEAVRLLTDTKELKNLTDIDRARFLARAHDLNMAQLRETNARKELDDKKTKLQNAMKIAELKVGIVSGKSGISDIEKALEEGIFDFSPDDYLSTYQLLNKANNSIDTSNAETLNVVKNKIVEGTISEDEIVDLRLKNLLNKDDTKELLSLLNTKKKTDGQDDSADKEFKTIAAKIDNGEISSVEQLNALYQAEDNPISRAAWQDGISYLNTKKNRENKTKETLESAKTEEKFKILAEMIDNNTITDENSLNRLYYDGDINRQVWRDAKNYWKDKQKSVEDDLKNLNQSGNEAAFKTLARMIDDNIITTEQQINELYYDNEKPIAKTVWERAISHLKNHQELIAKKDADKAKLDAEEKKLDALNNYLDDIAKVDDGTLNDVGIMENIRTGRYDEKRGDKLMERYHKKLAAEGKLGEGQKAVMTLNLYSDLERLYENPDARISDYEELNNKIVEYMNSGVIGKDDGKKILNTFSLSYMKKYQSDLENYGDTHFFGADEGFFQLNAWMDDIFGKDPKKPASTSKTEIHQQYNLAMGARARNKVEIYRLYADSLDAVAAAEGLKSSADILTLDKIKQTNLFNAAVELTKKAYGSKQYRSLNNNKANPTAILSSADGLVSVGGNDKEGKPLMETRVVQAGYDEENNTYALKFSDGTIKEVDYQTYKNYVK